MKVLVSDFLFPLGHKKLNMYFIEILSNIADQVIVTNIGGYYEKFTNNNIILNNIKIPKVLLRTKSPVFTRIRALFIFFQTKKLYKKTKSDIIFITAFDTVTMAFCSLANLRKLNMYLVHHNNVDELQSRIKILFFNLYKNNVRHLVLEHFIHERLETYFKYPNAKIFTILHPVYQNEHIKLTKFKYHYVALSNSNDEKLIKKIIDIEKKEMLFSKNEIRIIIKSKEYTYKNDYLTVFRGFIDKESYEDLILNSINVLLLFPDSYKYRSSGTLIDAIGSGKQVVGTNIQLMRNLSIEYPNLIRTFLFLGDLISLVKSDDELFRLELENFMNSRSNSKVKFTLCEILKGGG